MIRTATIRTPNSTGGQDITLTVVVGSGPHAGAYALDDTGALWIYGEDARSFCVARYLPPALAGRIAARCRAICAVL